jgi:hypothetical protein
MIFAISPGPTNPVHISLPSHGEIVVHHQADVLKINSPGSHIRGNQVPEPSPPGCVHIFKPFPSAVFSIYLHFFERQLLHMPAFYIFFYKHDQEADQQQPAADPYGGSLRWAVSTLPMTAPTANMPITP